MMQPTHHAAPAPEARSGAKTKRPDVAPADASTQPERDPASSHLEVVLDALEVRKAARRRGALRTELTQIGLMVGAWAIMMAVWLQVTA